MLKFSDIQLEQLQDSVINFKHNQQVDYSGDDESIALYWHKVGRLDQYKHLSQLALLLCLTPHSNAIAERIFSMIGKNVTDCRKSLRKDTTLTYEYYDC